IRTRQSSQVYEDDKKQKKAQRTKHDKSKPNPLRIPTAIEQRLFESSLDYHKRCDHSARFEVCEDEHCAETLRVLSVTGFLHRFDDPSVDVNHVSQKRINEDHPVAIFIYLLIPH